MWPLTGFFRRRFFKWLKKRIPAASEHHLNLNSIFILPTGFGWSFIVLSLCLFLLGTNYQNNLMLLLSYLCLSIMLLTLFYTHKNFAQLALKSMPPAPFHCNEEGELVVKVIPHINALTRHCSGELQLTWLNNAESSHADTELPPIYDTKNTVTQSTYRVLLTGDSGEHKQQVQTFTLPLCIGKRGRYTLGRLTVACDFPLGLYKCWTHLDFDHEVTVYAKPLEGPVLVEKVVSDEASDSASSIKDPSSNEDFYALGDYEIGQPLNRVSWKHVAKSGNWVSKSFTSQRNDSYFISISHAIDTEMAVSALTHSVILWTQSNRVFGLRYKSINIAPNHGVKHMHDCLNALACLDDTTSKPYKNTNKTVLFSSHKKDNTVRSVK